MSESPADDAPSRLIDDVEFGADVTVWPFANPYGCRIAAHTGVGAFAEIQTGAVIRAPGTISGHSFICAGVPSASDVA